MQYISSQAGTRMAKAKAALDQVESIKNVDALTWELAHQEFEFAAEAVADELIEQGFHKIEGD